MARSTSKRSRAARRGELEAEEQEDLKVNDLDSVPRLEKTDIIGPIIRASLKKNGQLLTDKLTKKHRHSALKTGSTEILDAGVHKRKQHAMLSKTVRSRRRRGVTVDGRLATKIETSLERRRNLRFVRRSDWDKVNEMAKESVEGKKEDVGADPKSADEVDVGEVGSGWKELTGQDQEDTEKKQEAIRDHKINAYELLDEVEA
ncbi:DEKNAAC100501 [Brettanomyces naardenensis]|uniref:DEKNAAC100501 n=1 Tax=Brettanomyces naardenensis TaxID=13370 RepID=A0A448YFL0_BRENA|nr:DEKNAAC100501 [Brettanomyces naardenensis]